MNRMNTPAPAGDNNSERTSPEYFKTTARMVLAQLAERYGEETTEFARQWAAKLHDNFYAKNRTSDEVSQRLAASAIMSFDAWKLKIVAMEQNMESMEQAAGMNHADRIKQALNALQVLMGLEVDEKVWAALQVYEDTMLAFDANQRIAFQLLLLAHIDEVFENFLV